MPKFFVGPLAFLLRRCQLLQSDKRPVSRKADNQQRPALQIRALEFRVNPVIKAVPLLGARVQRVRI